MREERRDGPFHMGVTNAGRPLSYGYHAQRVFHDQRVFHAQRVVKSSLPSPSFRPPMIASFILAIISVLS